MRSLANIILNALNPDWQLNNIIIIIIIKIYSQILKSERFFLHFVLSWCFLWYCLSVSSVSLFQERIFNCNLLLFEREASNITLRHVKKPSENKKNNKFLYYWSTIGISSIQNNKILKVGALIFLNLSTRQTILHWITLRKNFSQKYSYFFFFLR